MPFNLSWFVNRNYPLALFQRMLAGETEKRILLITVDGEEGKTCLLLRLFLECEQQRPPLPVALLDFDQRKTGLTDFLSVARRVRYYLGDARTRAICACEDEIARPRSAVNIQTGAGDAGVDWGRRSHFTQADISGIAGRDSINIGNVYTGPPTPEQIGQQQEKMGQALCSDLANLDRAVLLLDTFEHASPETCAWLEHWLFEPLRNKLNRVLLVVAGRPECRPFFDQPRLWGHLITRIDRFESFTIDETLTYYHRRGLTDVSVAEISFLQVACMRPALMAQLGDHLEQVRGGWR